MFTACKPTSNIITSKDVAVKKGIYKEPVLAKANTVKKVKPQREYVVKQNVQVPKPKRDLALNDKNEPDIIIEKDNSESTYLIEQLINSASSISSS